MQYDTINHLIFKNCFSIPLEFKSFESVIKEHCFGEKKEIKEKIIELSKINKTGKEIYLDVYSLRLNINYKELIKKFDNLFK